MSLPPALVKPVADALRIALEPSAKRVGAGLLALVEAHVRGQHKLPEERLLDIIDGDIAREDRRRAAIERLKMIASDPDLEHQRILARAAAEAVRGGFVMPVLEISGPIFRDSEFEREGSRIWEMWKELLARACDIDRCSQAHPAYPGIISQLSSDEARLLGLIAERHKFEFIHYYVKSWDDANGTDSLPFTDERWKNLLDSVMHYDFAAMHLQQLDLIYINAEYLPDEPLYEGSDRMATITKMECRITPWGQAFIESVTPERETAPPKWHRPPRRV